MALYDEFGAGEYLARDEEEKKKTAAGAVPGPLLAGNTSTARPPGYDPGEVDTGIRKAVKNIENFGKGGGGAGGMGLQALRSFFTDMSPLRNKSDHSMDIIKGSRVENWAEDSKTGDMYERTPLGKRPWEFSGPIGQFLGHYAGASMAAGAENLKTRGNMAIAPLYAYGMAPGVMDKNTKGPMAFGGQKDIMKFMGGLNPQGQQLMNLIMQGLQGNIDY